MLVMACLLTEMYPVPSIADYGVKGSVVTSPPPQRVTKTILVLSKRDRTTERLSLLISHVFKAIESSKRDRVGLL